MHAAQEDYDRFAALVSESYRIPPGQLEGRDRTRGATFARRVVAICLREKAYSYTEIADVMQRNHTTIIRLCRGQLEGIRGHTKTVVDVDVRRARSEAKRLLGGELSPRGPVTPREVKDTGRAEYDAALATYHSKMPHERDAFWVDYCRREFPHSWWRQAQMWPREMGNAAA
jgi:hypothetical protein